MSDSNTQTSLDETAPFDSSAFLKTVTSQPGVYRMYNIDSDVIYVGKAKDLKKRLSSYFRKKIDSEKTKALVSHIAKIDVTITHTETEALILEHNYIKQYLPKYNVLLRDDKSYPFIFLSGHKHPRVSIHRGAKKKKRRILWPLSRFWCGERDFAPCAKDLSRAPM
ncbi:excinuclease ABC subunit C [Vibrio astriarenae]|nr:excinuclease ABC subunit C [Vibrio sp. C7]